MTLPASVTSVNFAPMRTPRYSRRCDEPLTHKCRFKHLTRSLSSLLDMADNGTTGGGDKASKRKQRKPQTEEEFCTQKTQFLSAGPQINEEGWLLKDDTIDLLDPQRKIDRVQMLNACERAYFERDYHRCLELVAQAYQLFGVEDDDTEQLQRDFEALGRKTKKSAKVERHVVELGHIKLRCLAKLL